MTMAATMKDVAKDAGVSVATVSRYINQSGYISDSAKDKIKVSIDKLGYYPNEVARSLFKQSSKIIGLLVPDIRNPYFNLLVKAAEDYASSQGYLIVLADISEDDRKLETYSKLFSQYNISGLLVATGELIDSDRSKNLPKVYMDRITHDKEYCVINDNYYGGQVVADHINQTDAKNVLLVKGPESFKSSSERFEGVYDHLSKDLHIQTDQVPSYHVQSMRGYCQKILDRYPDPDTIICPNDVMAIEFIKECERRQIAVPETMQIVGYDGIMMGHYTSPSLTTVIQPVEQIGRNAVKMLIDRIEDKEVKDQEIILKPRLKVRESTRSD